jgi:hypothetical protein
MPTPRALAERIASTPFASDTEHRRQDASTTPANITLAAGAWEAFNPGSVAVYARLGSAVSIPASGGAAVAGQFVIPAGASVTFIAAAVALHVLTASGTATLELHRKPL